MNNLSPIVTIIIAIVVLGLVWRLVAGVIKFVLMLVIFAVAAYLVWGFIS